MRHAPPPRRRPLRCAFLAVALTLAPTGAHAVGGDDANTATKVSSTTQKCQLFAGKGASKYASRAATSLQGCLDAVLKCDEQPDAARALTCRRKLLRTGTGKCAVGKVDEDLSLIGAGAALGASTTPSSKAALVREMNRYVGTLGTKCISAGAELGDPNTGLGFAPEPVSAAELADAVNVDPGGLQCLVNGLVLQSHPLADEIIAILEPLHETCIDGPTLGASCTADAQCGTEGRCGRLARVFREGSIRACAGDPPVIAVCGNGAAEVPEQCDDGNLVGGDGCSATCTLEPANQLVATSQTSCFDVAGTVIGCAGTGQDGEIQAGASVAFLDNGNGTITDLRTGLVWEKFSDDGTIHDRDNVFTWTNAFDNKIATLNAAVFAGFADWRVPNYKELVSLLDLERSTPSIVPIFDDSCVPGCTVLDCSCTALNGYWTSTTAVGNPSFAWSVEFFDGFVNANLKTGSAFVRAVRGGE